MKVTNLAKKSNLFVIAIGSEDSYSYCLMESGRTMTETGFRDLVSKIQDEEWNEFIANNKSIVTGQDLWEKIIARLELQFNFSVIKPIEHFIYEFNFWDDKEEK